VLCGDFYFYFSVAEFVTVEGKHLLEFRVESLIASAYKTDALNLAYVCIHGINMKLYNSNIIKYCFLDLMCDIIVIIQSDDSIQQNKDQQQINALQQEMCSKVSCCF
jgi:ABC-type anion transport system duplicated permease subunit